MTAVTLRRFAHGDLPSIRQTLLDVHADAYAEEMGDEFVQRFPWFVDHWGGHPRFSCVVGYDGDEPVGFAYGAPATAGREWWREHLAEPPADDSTFSVSELMVRHRWRKTGTAERLHAALLADRPEALAVLLVDPDHPKVQSLYETWGYRRVGSRRPFADSPTFAVMLRDIRAAASA
ncbi:MULTISPECIES: GNAT family N-acetyltransferase [unclassified Streptomyces]|uniref:GNAT family N-acetyltransferase n=1 Tax=unclassified Streptomyces TaxID=2593676 RepID=UPI0016600DCA|nr:MULTISPECIES: GNAT family N-acetyltransferase [unclassified Streptomyces]MBD0711160.1 GNAT family N-acetyltransferase [Streptomyces sp. CBMA291]MBD0714191.1 GNAT family N-acetyltransferase [Streptomyces sp. CBMA370]